MRLRLRMVRNANPTLKTNGSLSLTDVSIIGTPIDLNTNTIPFYPGNQFIFHDTDLSVVRC
jgi:hypothetical protein